MLWFPNFDFQSISSRFLVQNHDFNFIWF